MQHLSSEASPRNSVSAIIPQTPSLPTQHGPPNLSDEYHHGRPDLSPRGPPELDESTVATLAFSPLGRHAAAAYQNALNREKTGHITSFPDEILINILANLGASDLLNVSLVCHAMNGILKSSDVWRTAFTRHFPGHDALRCIPNKSLKNRRVPKDKQQHNRRYFTRVTAAPSWRTEYLYRTSLLKNLARGRPAQVAWPGTTGQRTPHLLYASCLNTPVSHMRALFNVSNLSIVHGSSYSGLITSVSILDSDAPRPVGSLSDHMRVSEHATTGEMWGLGSGQAATSDNVMDVSETYGAVRGEGFDGGLSLYQPLSANFEVRLDTSDGERTGTSALWIAKDSRIPAHSQGLVGILKGTTSGSVEAYPIQTSPNARGPMRVMPTARWVLSPGVPIVSIQVDDLYSPLRAAQNRIWAVALNALGEVFYLTQFPKRQAKSKSPEFNPCIVGRSVYWNLVEESRRVAREDPYGDSHVDWSYSPRSSWSGMCLAAEQIEAETREIEEFAKYRPIHFRTFCDGWDMRRRMVVDFAGEDRNSAGENIAVIRCGLGPEEITDVKRFTRINVRANEKVYAPVGLGLHDSNLAVEDREKEPSSSGSSGNVDTDEVKFSIFDANSEDGIDQTPIISTWVSSTLAFGVEKPKRITATAMDNSKLAIVTLFENTPYLGSSTDSSPTSTPSLRAQNATPSSTVPGQNARLFAVGTGTGSIFVWNIRSAASIHQAPIAPVRIIHTDSPCVTSLALTSLYLVHGGNDGLVQAWDLLASFPRAEPIRTLNSKLTQRARMRFTVANSMDVTRFTSLFPDIDYFAASAIILDPEPTRLRGAVALGTQVRYWNFAGPGVLGGCGPRKKTKHRKRAGKRARDSRSSSPTVSPGTRRHAALHAEIMRDYREMKDIEADERRENDRRHANLQKRFGIELGDEEGLRMAIEASERESRSSPALPGGGGAARTQTEGGFSDEDMAEALRRSLADLGVGR